MAWKFCYHPLLLLKICPLLWAALLFMHCSCMLMEERSIHRLIWQYFATVSNFGVLLAFLFFLSLEFCYICYFCDFCDICHGCVKLAGKILVTFAIFAIFADISGSFLASSVSKSWFLLDLLFLRYLSRVFLASKKNPCYICDFCDICGHFGAFLGFFCFQVLILFRYAIFVTGVFS